MEKWMSDSEYCNDNNGCNCPKCKSENISGGGFNADNGIAWRECECDDCGATWTENFTLTSYTPADE